MAVQKRYFKTKDIGRVTFRLPKEAAPEATDVYLVGEFNGWDTTATRMQRLKSGEFKVTMDLAPGRDYEYRYLIDGKVWENDWEADRYQPASIFGCENSVVAV